MSAAAPSISARSGSTGASLDRDFSARGAAGRRIAATNLDHLPDRLEQPSAFVPDVRDERGSDRGRLAGHHDELLRARIGAGDVDEPE